MMQWHHSMHRCCLPVGWQQNWIGCYPGENSRICASRALSYKNGVLPRFSRQHHFCINAACEGEKAPRSIPSGGATLRRSRNKNHKSSVKPLMQA